jgi:hypothetical protein
MVSPTIARICQEFGHSEDEAKKWLSQCRYDTLSHQDISDQFNIYYYLRYANTPPASFAVDYNATVHSLQILKKVGLVDDHFFVEMLWEDTKSIVTLK